MDLYFLRHASAGEAESDRKKDQKRPLDEDGVLQARYIGHLLSQLEVQLDAVISSPLKRATQTASIAANEIAFEGKIEFSDALRPEASFDEFLQMIKRHSKSDAVMVVGHNPTMSEFLGRLLGSGEATLNIDMKKGAVAKVEMRGKSAVMMWLITPKIARAIHPALKASSRPKTSRK